ncbi:MAG: PAS domain-containing protein [Chitinispirillaceae bacterium]|nr:PAS domain-containing protein [Chitinispirillaceae bacterium]
MRGKTPVKKHTRTRPPILPKENPGGSIKNKDTDSSPKKPLTESIVPVVGIGASAGGLAAFEAFFSGMPEGVDPGMAFVLVQHLAPDHKSLLAELVQRYTRMQVFEVENGIRVQINCAYIIPPNRDLALINGTLQLLEQKNPHGPRLPIDFFFRTLAEDRREQAICIVLSGTGSDGTQGIRAVKAEGGMVMAQDPETTTYRGMPQSAIATGMVDYILPPAGMPKQLMAYIAHAFGKLPTRSSVAAGQTGDAIKNILLLIRSHSGHDFTLYKTTTVNRRIERRMALHQIDQPDGYLRYLQQNPDEIEALFRDFCIGVTGFFRDPDAFSVLENRVIADLFRNVKPGASLRVWVPGCSSGEEAYTIAFLLQEHLDTLRQRFRIQVFATDIDRHAIDTARAGSYPAGITSNVPADRLSRFFTRNDETGEFRINKTIRDMLVFSEQNVIRDPPFSRIDLISCRNLLIYMNVELQKKLIPLFHYALNPGGILFLGTSETVGDFIDLFSPVDRKAKIYQRIGDTFGSRATKAPAPASLLSRGTTGPQPALHSPDETITHLRMLSEKTFMQHFAPVGVLVNGEGDILYLHGRTGMYLEPSPGTPGMNILRMAREGLRSELTALLHTAGIRKKPVSRPGIRVKTNGAFTTVNVTVRPVTGSAGSPPATPLLLVIIEEPAGTPAPSLRSTHAMNPDERTDAENQACIAGLRQELRIKEEYLQTTIEELNSSGEEMQSVNEELQSSNEELETSKEELQSVNEELATVNMELQTKVTDLTRVNNDMNNLLAGTGIGTIFVDSHLLIRRFTPAVTKLINLIQSDVGRPVNHVVSNLVGYDRLREDIQAVLDTLIPKEDEVQTGNGGWYLLRIQPYRTLENVIEGAVITFIDITKQHDVKRREP